MGLASPPKRVKRELLLSSTALPPSVLSSPSSQRIYSPRSPATKSNHSSHSYRSSLASDEPSCPSPPICLEAFFPPSPGAIHRRPSLDNSNFISPVNDNFFCRSQFRPSVADRYPTHNPIAASPYAGYRPQNLALPSARSPLRSPVRRPSPRHAEDHVEDLFNNRHAGPDPFPCDMSGSLHEIDSVGWNHDATHDLCLDMKPPSVATSHSTLDANAARSLISRLDTFHEHARDSIMSAPEPEQASLTNAYANWALHVARDPLGGNDLRRNDTMDRDISDAFDMGPSAIV